MAANLARLATQIQTLNASQEKAKQEVGALTDRIGAATAEATREYGKLLRFAEATFGPKDHRIRQFRPVSEGRLRGGKTPKEQTPQQ